MSSVPEHFAKCVDRNQRLSRILKAREQAIHVAALPSNQLFYEPIQGPQEGVRIGDKFDCGCFDW